MPLGEFVPPTVTTTTHPYFDPNIYTVGGASWAIPAAEEKKSNKVLAKIRVTFNRNLTYAERETLRSWVEEQGLSDDGISIRFSDPARLWVSDISEDDSRNLYNIFAGYVAENFVNVHPVAVRTFVPEVKV